MDESVETKYLLIAFDVFKSYFVNNIISLGSLQDPLMPVYKNYSKEIKDRIQASQNIIRIIPYFDSFEEETMVEPTPEFGVTAYCHYNSESGFRVFNACQNISIPLPLSLFQKGVKLALSYKTLQQIRERFLKCSGIKNVLKEDFMITSILTTHPYWRSK